MAITAIQARARTNNGQRTREAREKLEQIARLRAIDAEVEKQAGWAREKLDTAIVKAANDGLDHCAVWFPEHEDIMRKVRTAIAPEYRNLGYEVDGGPVADSRFNKYEISLKWAEVPTEVEDD